MNRLRLKDRWGGVAEPAASAWSRPCRSRRRSPAALSLSLGVGLGLCFDLGVLSDAWRNGRKEVAMSRKTRIAKRTLLVLVLVVALLTLVVSFMLGPVIRKATPSAAKRNIRITFSR